MRAIRLLVSVPILAGLFVLGVVTLATLSPARTVTARSQAAADCALGDWEAEDFSAYMRSVVESGDGPAVETVSGTARLTLRADGTMDQSIDNGVVMLRVTGLGVLTVTVNAVVSAPYQETSPGTLTVTPPVTATGTADATLNGESVATDVPVAELMAMASDSRTDLRYECSADRLLVSPQVPDRAVEPVVYVRR
jgi:hypothetical protein